MIWTILFQSFIKIDLPQHLKDVWTEEKGSYMDGMIQWNILITVENIIHTDYKILY